MQKIVVFIALIVCFPVIRAQNQATSWTGYRGNLDNGYSLAKQVPLHWSDSTNVRWKVPVP
jgi:hypothetical protein